MIFWSHFKCMCTEPGVLPKNYDTLAFSKLKPDFVNIILNVKKEIKRITDDEQMSIKDMMNVEKEIEAQIEVFKA